MSDFLKIGQVAASGMRAQSSRLRVISENLANADTPGYHRKQVSFQETGGLPDRDGLVPRPRVDLDQSPLPSIYDPSHPMADATGHYDGTNVDMVVEVADAREAQRSYEANLKMFDQARTMTRSLLDLLKG